MLITRLLIITYLALHLAPIFFARNYLEQLEILNFAGRRWDLNLILISIFFVTFFQLTISLALSAKIANLRKAFSGTLGFGVALFANLPIALLEIFTFISWGYFDFSAGFLNLESLWISHFVLDSKAIGLVSVGSDWDKILLWLSFGIVGFLLQNLIRWSLSSGAIRQLKSHLIFQLVILIGLNITAFFFALNHGVNSFLSIVKGNIWPQYALAYSFIPEFGESEVLESLEQDLEAAVNVQEYVRSNPLEADAPNIILIVVEALRYDSIDAKLSETWVMPSLRSLAKEGVSFERAYSQAPETDYSQVTILTGQYPLRSKSRDLRINLEYPYVLLFDLLHYYGYKTAHLTNEWMVTRRQTASKNLDLYFNPTDQIPAEVRNILGDEFLKVNSFAHLPTSEMDQIKLRVLERWVKSQASNPIFAEIFLYASHFPYEVIPPVEPVAGEKYELNEPYSFYDYGESLSGTMRRRYYTTLRYIDSLIAKIQSLAASPAGNRETLIVVTGDHGELFGEHGLVTHAGHLCPEVLHIPLIFWSSKRQLSSAPSDLVAGHVDIAPSILNYLSLPRLNLHQGTALIGKKSVDSNDLKSRPLYSSVQTFVTENSVIQWPWMYNSNLVCGPLINLESGEVVKLESQPTLASYLEGQINQFIKSQIGYYKYQKSNRSIRRAPPTYK